MELDILKKLEEQKIQIDNIFKSVEKTRKYFLWTLIITIVLFVLPLIGIIFVLPTFLGTYISMLQGLGL
ncbi:hypothetical protein H0W32_03000 [Patescibacteria group bacterium]|nr:hypothetical protein [Patescibacteria group bacterium]